MEIADDARRERIAGLRAYADLLEGHPQPPAPGFVASYLPAVEDGRALRIIAVDTFFRVMPDTEVSVTGGDLWLTGRLPGLTVRMATEAAGIGEKATVVKQVEEWSFTDLPFLTLTGGTE